MNDLERDKMMNETHDTVIELKTVLLGKNGDKGLVGQIVDNTRRSNLNRVIIASMLGASGLGGGIFGLIKALGG